MKRPVGEKLIRLGGRVAVLRERVRANERAANRALVVGERALKRAEKVLTKRFDAGNEIKGAMKEASEHYVTREEVKAQRDADAITMRWLIGLIVGLALAVIGQYVKHP